MITHLPGSLFSCFSMLRLQQGSFPSLLVFFFPHVPDTVQHFRYSACVIQAGIPSWCWCLRFLSCSPQLRSLIQHSWLPFFQEISHLQKIKLCHNLSIFECLSVTWDLNLELLFISRALSKPKQAWIFLVPWIYREASPSVLLVFWFSPQRAAGVTRSFFCFWRNVCPWRYAQLWEVKMQISAGT